MLDEEGEGRLLFNVFIEWTSAEGFFGGKGSDSIAKERIQVLPALGDLDVVTSYRSVIMVYT